MSSGNGQSRPTSNRVPVAPAAPAAPFSVERIPAVTTDSVEVDAKERATAVVLGWRAIVWDAVERGEDAAVAALQSACEAHESVHRFLVDEAGELGARLDAGLERYYAEHVGPH